MSLYIPPGEYEVAFMHNQAGNSLQAVCTCGFRYSGDAFETDHVSLALAWVNKIVPLMSGGITLTAVKFSTDEGTVTTIPLGDMGGAPGTGASYNVAYLIHKENLTVGRRGRGRMFIPGVTEDAIDAAGRVNTTGMGSWNTELQEFYDACVAADFQPVLFHTPRAGNLTPPSSFITRFSIDALAATQRNRMRR